MLKEHKSATLKDPPAGISSRRVDHIADLVVAKAIGNPLPST